MLEPDGSGAHGAPLDLGRSGERWARWLRTELARRPGPPEARLLGLWDVLEAWFASDRFRASAAAQAAVALRLEPGDEVAVLASHRRAVKALLEDLASAAGAGDPEGLASTVHILLEGAVAAALIDGRPSVARTARALTQLALDHERAGGEE